jgi:hypothetical protein
VGAGQAAAEEMPPMCRSFVLAQNQLHQRRNSRLSSVHAALPS